MCLSIALIAAQRWKNKPNKQRNMRKARLNTMPKAILELEMPESCTECMFKECLNRTTSVEVSRCIILHKMHVPGSYCPAEGRQADCPLKPVEDKEVE